MATVRDLSLDGSGYLDEHIAAPGANVDTTGLATELTLEELVTASTTTNTHLSQIEAAVEDTTEIVPVTSPPPETITVTIANGASLSGAAQVEGKLNGIIIPAAWTAAAISFQVSPDGVTYYDLFDGTVERSIASATVTALIGKQHHLTNGLNDWTAVNFIKIRSGLTAAPVNQGASRDLILVMAG